MKAVVIQKTGTPVADNIAVVDDFATPEAGPGQVVVATEASALNHLDLWVGRGLPGLDRDYPAIGGSDGVGVVESVGEGVDPGWVGRRVILNAAVRHPDPVLPERAPAPDDLQLIGEHSHGTHAERFVAPVQNVLEVGEVDPVQAAAFGLTHLTAWRMLVTRAGLRVGQSVLITGIGGGVALAALNISRHLGCHTIVTSRSAEKLERARELGADVAVLDEGQDMSREIRGASGKRGVDVAVDSVGGPLHLACVKSLARGGTLVLCGCTAGHNPPTDLARIFWNQLRVVGSTMGDADEFRQVVSLFRSGALKPVVDSVHAAADAKAAFGHLEAGEQFGKVVLRWS